MTRRIAGWTAIALLVLATAWDLASPRLVLRAMRESARAGDAAAVSSHVDYPALRDSVKTQMNRAIARRVAKEGILANPIALAMVSRIASRQIDDMVTPEALALAFARPQTAGNPIARTWASGRIDVERDGLDAFSVVNPEDPRSPRLIFARDWPTWKLSAVRMPGDLIGEAH